MKAKTVSSNIIFAVVCAGLMVWLVAGCGQSEPQNTGAFKQAIVEYLKSNSMDLRVDSFRTLEKKGNTAKANVSLAYAGEGVGVKVRWNFEFEKADGSWRVIRHSER